MYEAAIIIAMIAGYLLGNSIDKKLEKDARDDMKHRDKMRKRFGSNSVSDEEILSEIRYKEKKIRKKR